MSKLYPPYIEGTIPAFAGNEIVVPFSMNRAVGRNNVAGFSLKIKTVQNSVFITELKSISFDLDNLKAYFTLSEKDLEKIKVGNYYKLQMAYIANNGEIGYFSTVGVIKCTAMPEVYIEGLKNIGTNSHDHSYLGVYRQPLPTDGEEDKGDITEKVYTSRFVITNPDNSIYYDSGEFLHNATDDVRVNESTEYFEILDDLPEKKSFYIKYMVKTNNGLEVSSRQYKIMQRKTLESDFVGELSAEMFPEDGYVELRMTCDVKELGYIPVVTGAYLLSRANVRDMTKWEPLYRFILQSETPNRFIMKDCTVEHGEIYIYSLQQYNDRGLYSNRIYSEEVYVDFEDLFLFDGTRQLRVRFDPKVSSFKNTILETKVDTIGSQHPFIFRNGKVAYKEFPISGLISYFTDEAKMFFNDEDFDPFKNLYRKETQSLLNTNILNKTKTINLTSQNVYKEKTFKLEVLDWLTNGETKLFRSPTEGNYLVRLMNVSLAPNDTLGRMLHTFSCTAYEVAKNTHQNRLTYGVINLDDPKDTRTRWATRNLMVANEEGKLVPWVGEVLEHFTIANQKYVAQSLTVTGMTPGDCFYINVPAGEEASAHPECKIIIGATGSYTVDGVGDITSIYFDEPNEGISTRGSITFSFVNSSENKFSLVSDIEIKDEPLKQIIGAQRDVKELVQDIKTDVYGFDILKVYKRPVYLVYEDDNNNWYWNKIAITKQDEVDKTKLDPLGVYEVRRQSHQGVEENVHSPESENYHMNEEYYIKERFNELFPLKYYFDGSLNAEIDYDTTFTIDEVTVDLVSGRPFIATDIEFDKFRLGSGLYLEASYVKYIKSYYLEEENKNVMLAWNAYQAALLAYQEDVAKGAENEDTLSDALTDAYAALLVALEDAIREYNIEHGLIVE